MEKKYVLLSEDWEFIIHYGGFIDFLKSHLYFRLSPNVFGPIFLCSRRTIFQTSDSDDLLRCLFGYMGFYHDNH